MVDDFDTVEDLGDAEGYAGQADDFADVADLDEERKRRIKERFEQQRRMLDALTSKNAAAEDDARLRDLVREERLRQEARRIVAAEKLADEVLLDTDDPAVDAFEAELLDVDKLAERPALKPLIEGWLARNTLVRLSGHPGSYKSFLALDWACHVATGRTWYGHRVTKGPVVYVVGEGEEGIYKRVRAWELHHDTHARGVLFLPRPVQTAGPEWVTFCRAMVRVKPALVVLDTQARVTVGANENVPSEFAPIVERWDALRRVTGATVLLIHHLNADGSRPRGSTAVQGAVHAEYVIEKEERGEKRYVKIANTKQKDDAEREPFRMRVEVVKVADPERDGPAEGPQLPQAPVTSVVLVTDPLAAAAGSDEAERASKAEELFEFLLDTYGESETGFTRSEVRSIVVRSDRNRSGFMSKNTFPRAWARLERERRLRKHDKYDRWFVVPREVRK